MAVASPPKEQTSPPPGAAAVQTCRSPSPSVGPVKQDAADAASESSSTYSGEPSDRRDVDILTHVLSTRSEEYRLLFRLPPDEVLVQDFNCALQENILLQGHMYLFIHHICFYSNIFGFETKKTIPFNEVTCVRKAKTAAIFPNAIEIVVAGGKKYFFGSFLSRDEAHRLISDGWAQHSCDAKAFQDRQDSKSDASSQDNIFAVLEENGSKRLADYSLSVDRISDSRLSEECKPLPDGEDDFNLSRKLAGVQENGGYDHADHSSSEDPISWQCEDVDAPTIADHFAMVAEAKFPICVEDFFSLYVSDQAAGFMENFRRRCGDKDFRCTPWRQHEQFERVRDVTFLHPIKIYCGAKFGHCHEIQKFRVYRNSHLVIETSQQISDVPYGDYFQVEGIWDVEQDNDEENCCTLRVYLNVAFSKKTIFRGKIEQSTRDECRDVYGLWIALAHQVLKQRKVSRLQGITDQNAAITEDHDVKLHSSRMIEGSSEQSHPIVSPAEVPQHMLDAKNSSPQVEKFMQEALGYFSSMVSIFREPWATFNSYIKTQSHSSLIIILALVAILILMQISIIFLVIRVPEVHLVTHGNYVSDPGSYGTKNMEQLEERIKYLKEEMLIIENRMERMHYEYKLLKANLQRIERPKAKS